MPRAVRTRAHDGDPRLLRALAEPTRQRILAILGAEEMRAKDIAARFDSARPTIAKHLKVLREVGLVRVRASGRERWYSIGPGPLRDAAARVRALDDALRAGLEALGRRLDERR